MIHRSLSWASCLLVLLLGCLFLGCEKPGSGPAGPRPVDAGIDAARDGSALTCRERQTVYLGISGQPLQARTPEISTGHERRRLKPFGVIEAEFRSFFPPSSLPVTVANAFGNMPARWFEEPKAGAIAINAIYDLAYRGCTGLAEEEDWSESLDIDESRRKCSEWMLRFWGRLGSTADQNQCAALLDEAGEQNSMSALERSTQTCAALLTSTEFLTY